MDLDCLAMQLYRRLVHVRDQISVVQSNPKAWQPVLAISLSQFPPPLVNKTIGISLADGIFFKFLHYFLHRRE